MLIQGAERENEKIFFNRPHFCSIISFCPKNTIKFGRLKTELDSCFFTSQLKIRLGFENNRSKSFLLDWPFVKMLHIYCMLN
jgi:hypothetical protein